ncbi:hypothetical protein AOQ84DRAFT_379106 [Glonium stellatum]|uniref:Uncharacterized protein n=1 Tax=Glonium stellatum TaxID=574774 RepID=A0A8E2JQM5_9PEZI|nr:hypothetical protein AOQ84DRAFT_379106 [Glonium stellatum]
MNSKFKQSMEIKTLKHPKPRTPSPHSTHKQFLAPEPVDEATISRPTPKPWRKFNSPIFINHSCPASICEGLLALSEKHPQCLDFTYAAQHVPLGPVIFVALPRFYTNEQNAVGFFVPVNVIDGDEGSGEDDGYKEMFFTACSDADLETPAMREQLRSPISGTEGRGEAIMYQKGETEFRAAWTVAAEVWKERVDEHLFMRGK